MKWGWAAVSCFLVATGCATSSNPNGENDAAATDASTTDAAASTDAATTDAATIDAATIDAATIDAVTTDAACVSNCSAYSCGEIEPCGAVCGDACDIGCTDHCSDGFQDCDETEMDCGGATCGACNCVPDCTSYSCAQIEPTCGSTCGNVCDFGCTDHCSNGFQDCDETGMDCGGATCGACACVPDCTILGLR